MLLKGTRTAVLTVGALDLLMGQEEGCCPHCCGMCWVLQDMVRHGDLDETVRKAPISMYEDSAWFDSKRGTVHTTLLAVKWDSNCDHGIEEEEEEEDDEETPPEKVA